jgi:hypothetical protein
MHFTFHVTFFAQSLYDTNQSLIAGAFIRLPDKRQTYHLYFILKYIKMLNIYKITEGNHL